MQCASMTDTGFLFAFITFKSVNLYTMREGVARRKVEENNTRDREVRALIVCSIYSETAYARFVRIKENLQVAQL